MKRNGWVVLAAVAALCAGCSGSSEPDEAASPATSARPGPQRTASASPAGSELPEGISKLGSSVELSDEWQLTTGPLAAVSTAKDEPAGWKVVTSSLTFKNTSSSIQEVPEDVDLIARYGTDGREARPYVGPGVKGLEQDPYGQAGTPVRVAPGGTYVTKVGFSVPAEAAGKPLTFTLDPDGVPDYFEDAIPGASSSAPVTAPSATKAKTYTFGQWHDSSGTYVRVAAPVFTKSTAAGRVYDVDVSFFNTDEYDSLEMKPEGSLSAYFGNALTEADVDGATLYDGFIAPRRTATVTASVTLPAKAVPGPVTIEVNDDGTAVNYTGRLEK